MPGSRKGKPNKYKDYYVLDDVYKYYSSYVVKGSKYDVSLKEAKRIWKAVLKEAMSEILLEANEINLGSNLGTIRIKKLKTSTKALKLDYKLTKEYGKNIYHLNLHTNGYHVKFHWAKKKCKVIGKKPYSFIANRLEKTKLSSLFGGGKTDYFE